MKNERKWLIDIKNFFISHYLIIVIAGIAVLTRFYRIDRESLWLDEAISFVYACLFASIQNIYKYLFHTLWWDEHPIFYYFVLHYWIKLFGTGECALRSLSAILAILIIIITYYVGTRLISKRVGIIASILVLTNPLNLWYSQEARMYSLTSLLILLSSYFLFRLLSSEKGAKTLVPYILTSVVLLYTDYLGILVLGIHIFYGFFYVFFHKKLKLKTLLLCYISILTLYIPWIATFYNKLSIGGTDWMTSPTLGKGMQAFLIIVGASTDELFSFFSSPLVYAIVGLTGFICFIIIIVGVAVSLKKRAEFKFLLMLICFTPVAMFIESIIMIPIFSTRQISVFVPEIVLMIAIGLNNIPYLFPKIKFLSSKKLFISLLMPIVLMNSFNIYLIYNFDTKQNWRGTAKYIEENIKREDIILLNPPFAKLPFDYYYRGYVEVKKIKSTKELGGMISEYQRIWLIHVSLGSTDQYENISKYLNAKALNITSKKFTRGIDVKCYEVR